MEDQENRDRVERYIHHTDRPRYDRMVSEGWSISLHPAVDRDGQPVLAVFGSVGAWHATTRTVGPYASRERRWAGTGWVLDQFEWEYREARRQAGVDG